MANSSLPFDDFLELDLLDSSSNNMFPFMLNNEDLNSQSDLTSTLHSLDDSLCLTSLDLLDTGATYTMDMPMIAEGSNTNTSSSAESVICDGKAKTNIEKEVQQCDIQLLLAMNQRLQEQLREQQQVQVETTTQISANVMADTTSSSTNSKDSIDGVIDTKTLVAQMATPTSLSQLKASASNTLTTTCDINTTPIATAAMTATVDVQNASRIITYDNAPTTTATKRPSLEPTPAAKKIAKIETIVTAVAPALKTGAEMNNSRPPIEVQNSPALPAVMQIPFVPQLFNRKLTRKQIEETLAQLLESTKYLLMASQEVIADESSASQRSESESTEEIEKSAEQTPGRIHGLKAQPGIKIDDIPSSSDLKKMTSKERRQLRNKISARNFRVRRKEYIEQLESQVEQHKTEARHLREAVAVVHAENKRLREELEVAKRQSTQVTSSNVSDINAPQLPLVTPVPALSTENQVLLASIFSQSCLGSKDKVNATTNTLSRPHSSLLTPNLKKDMPNTPYIGDNAWKDANPISVHTAFVPEIVLKDQPFLRQGSLCLKEDELWNRPWLENERTPKELSKVDKNPFLVTSVVYELMQTLACEWLGAMNFLETQSVTCAFTLNEDKALVQDYEDGVHRIETINGETRCDKKMGAQMAFSRPQMCGMAVSELLEGFYRMLFGQKPPASCALDARWLFGLDLTFLFSLEVC